MLCLCSPFMHFRFSIIFFQVEIDYVQCSDLDMDAVFDPTVANPMDDNQETIPEQHKAMFNPDEVKELHGG